MRSRRSSCIASRALLLGFLLSSFGVALAQGHGDPAPRTVLTRPDAVDEKDTLKDFHRALAVQATSAQIAEFQAWLKTTDSAKVELQPFLQQSQPAASASGLDQSLETARTQTRNFLDGFSDKQKLGLKEQIRLLDRADTELSEQQKKLDQASQISSTLPAELAASASSLDKALQDFSAQQLGMAREMGIVLANPQDVTFNLPAVKSTVTFANQPLQFTVSGILSQTGADGSKRNFRLAIMDDLTDFQQNITEVMRGAVDNENACGERLSVRRAVLMPSVPGGSLNLQLHYERWACLRIAGQSTSTELAENDGEVEIHLLPAISQDGLQLKADFGRIDAVGMMADSLRNGQLGSDLRDIVVHAVLTAMRTTADFKTALPPALQGSKLETAQFEDDGAGDLTLMLQGQTQLSDEQTKSLASQLNQTLAAEDNGTK
jgi:hypothetical protein